MSPTPTRGRATIRYQLGRAGPVSCTVIDAAGRTVEVLYEGFQEAGMQSLVWESGGASPGVYVCRVAAGDRVWSTRLVKTP